MTWFLFAMACLKYFPCIIFCHKLFWFKEKYLESEVVKTSVISCENIRSLKRFHSHHFVRAFPSSELFREGLVIIRNGVKISYSKGMHIAGYANTSQSLNLIMLRLINLAHARCKLLLNQTGPLHCAQ